ncbi:MAG TPA: terminase family protein [Thermoleophilaceae bacterium]|nr:terminase family protein [Thermoleophilaceae bacterium]
MAPFQLRAFEDPASVVVVVAPRQSGKSRSLATYAAWRAFRSAGARVLVVSASEEASRRLLRDVRALVAASPLLAGSVEAEQGQLLQLSNGSEVRSVSASERAIRGWSVTDLLLDEAAMLPEPIFAAALPTVAAREGARVVMASSATVSSGPFYDHAVAGAAGSEHVSTHGWALADATWLSASWIASMRASMSELRFRAEMEGVFASGADALFTADALDRVTADYRLESIDTLVGPARVMGGVDWGQTTDRSALVAVARLPTPERTFAVAMAHRWPAGAPLTGPPGSPGVVEQIAAAPAHFQALVAEANGLGGPLAGRGGLLWALMARRHSSAGGARPNSGVRLVVDHGGIPGWDPEAELKAERRRRLRHGPAWRTQNVSFTTTAESKAAGYSSLRLLIDQGRLLLPASGEELRRELLMLRVDLSPTGLERVEAGSGHDDLADALQLATWPRRTDRGGWGTVLAGLANPERRLPDAIDPVPVGEMVRTGGGLEVPRRPCWLSVGGPELTVPGSKPPTYDPEQTIPLMRRAT